MISTVVVTINAEKLLRDCLESVAKDCQEIIIVDLGSNDKTLDLAKEFSAKIFKHSKVDYVEQVRNFAVSKAEGEWILVLDPDERITPALWKKLKRVVWEDKYIAVNIPRKNIFFGHWIAHTNWWPDRLVRFFKKGKVNWTDKIHRYPLVEGAVLNLPAKENLAIEHFGYSTVDEFISRQSRYSTIKAQNLYEQGIKFSWVGFFWNPTREFLVRYIRHLGFLDGFHGFALTFLMMVYQLEVMIKIWDLERQK